MDTKLYLWTDSGRCHFSRTWSRPIAHVYWSNMAWRRSTCRHVLFWVNLKLIRVKFNEFFFDNFSLNQKKNLAKVIPSKRAAYISYDGEEIPKENYEVLCNGNVTWVHCMPMTRTVPPFALCCGITAAGEPIYIGM